MTAPVFTLAVVTSAYGFIARRPDEPPQASASPEEQALFFADVEAVDWAVMGRRTHAAADRPDRRRIVFSATGGAGEWRRSTQLWSDPGGLAPRDLSGLVAAAHSLRAGLILGGTRVHDWFLAHGAIDRIHLTVEPVTFGTGLPLFSGAAGRAESCAPAASGAGPPGASTPVAPSTRSGPPDRRGTRSRERQLRGGSRSETLRFP